MALTSLRIRGLAVVDDATLRPGPRFAVLSGETGAGKSVCVTALRLALGLRPDGDPVAPAAARTEVEAVFDAVPEAVRERLRAVEIEPGPPLTLARNLPRSGRGACRINGIAVPLAVLREVGCHLVELTVQGESHRLLQPAAQLAMLDAAGGRPLQAAAERCADAVGAWQRARAGLAAAERELASLDRRRSDAEALVAELEPLRLRDGDAAELAAERDRLRHAEALRTAIGALGEACNGDEGAAAADRLHAAAAAGDHVRGVDAAVDALIETAARLGDQLRELGRDARRVLGELVVDDARLAGVEQRLDVLERVRRRFGDVAAAVAELEAAQAVVARLSASGDAIAGLRRDLTTATDAAVEAAAALTDQRRSAARRLETTVGEWLAGLGLEAARFRVVTGARDAADGLRIGGRTVACDAGGADTVEFRLATSARGLPLPLGQGQSGGELSRLALALRAAVGDAVDAPTLVLDEVDTGIGGETAARVGGLLAAIGGRRQVLAVTHRAEIAARASQHTVVERTGATSTLRDVAGEARVAEVARLLSGRATPAALARARELLDEGAPMVVAEAPRSRRRRPAS